jgi:hypothetical protein
VIRPRSIGAFAFAFAFSLLASACAKLAGISDYSVANDASVGPKSYLTGAGCTDCLSAQCSDTVPECAERQGCLDPLAACQVGATNSYRIRDCELSVSVVNDSFWTCAAKNCAERCNLGKNLYCVGKSEPPSTQASVIDVTFASVQ